LLASYISRKRWEWREEAITRMSVQAEAMSGGKTSSAPATNGQVNGHSGGINYGPPPLAELAMLGFDMDM
jgi:hypothetical protein